MHCRLLWIVLAMCAVFPAQSAPVCLGMALPPTDVMVP